MAHPKSDEAEKVEISPDCRRGLVLVSKVIQNLANGIAFGEKEQHMTITNSFISSNMICAEAFFEFLSKPPSVDFLQLLLFLLFISAHHPLLALLFFIRLPKWRRRRH